MVWLFGCLLVSWVWLFWVGVGWVFGFGVVLAFAVLWVFGVVDWCWFGWVGWRVGLFLLFSVYL